MRKDAVAALRPGVNVTSSYSEANGETIQYPDADGTFVPPTEQEIQAKLVQLRAEQAMFLLRYERDQRLAEADRMIMKYNTTNQAVPSAWKRYMQQLRNLPQTATPTLNAKGRLNMASVTWPAVPAARPADVVIDDL